MKLESLESIVENRSCSYGEELGAYEHTYPVAKVSNVGPEGEFKGTFEQRSFPYSQLDSLLVDEGDLLVVKSSGSSFSILSGKTAFCDKHVAKKLVPSNFLLNLRPLRECVWPRYLWYYLNSKQAKQFVARIVGATTYPNIKWSSYKAMQVPLPPLPEQRRIADILDKADAIRRKRQAAISTLDEIKLSQFERWFSAWFQPNAEQDYVPVSHIVSRFEGGLNVATPESPTPKTRHFILKVSAVTWGDYRPDESKPLPPEFNPPDEHIVRKGDLLFSRANTTELVGATVFVFDTPPNRVLPDKLWRFVWKNPSEVEPLFVWALLNHPKIRYEIGRRATGTSGSMKNISMEKVMSIRVPWPDIETQRRFSRFTTEERELRNRMSSSKNDADNLFNSLVQRAFRGEL